MDANSLKNKNKNLRYKKQLISAKDSSNQYPVD